MADLMDSEILEDRQGSQNSDDHLQINLMDVASLLPSSQSPPPRNRKTAQKHSKNESHKPEKPLTLGLTSGNVKDMITSQKRSSSRKSESRSSLFDNLGIHMVDELLNFNVGNNKTAQLDISEESEIKTESTDKQKKTAQRQHSQSEISDEQRKTSLLQQISTEESVSELSRIEDKVDRRRRQDLDGTDLEYSDSFDSESQTITQSFSQKSTNKKSRSGSQRSKKNLNSHKIREHKVVMEEMQVDVSTADLKGGTHHWNTSHMDIRVSTPYGLQYVDPTPIATHIVSADALEALTAYSPNMLALQDMMKSQLQLVHNFVDIQHRIYQSCMDGLNYDYKYTTLEDTKEYINRHKKPSMTFQDALELVEHERITT